MKGAYKYLFGPVPSRRLGRSLGVDLTPFKTCTLNCIFCQLGRTMNSTLDRKEYVPVAEVKQEIRDWALGGGVADYLTLSGSGEPTLHSRFGEVLQYARDATGFPVVLLSNGTLFWQAEVRDGAKRADIVKLTLSAWDPVSFAHIHRPHPDLKFQQIMDGYRTFREEFHGKLWIEVFLLGGINAIRRDVEKIAALVETMSPDEIHLNTSVRPPAEDFAFPVSSEDMEMLADLFRPRARVMAEFRAGTGVHMAAREETILALLARRPCTAEQVAQVFGMHRNEVAKYTGELTRSGRIRGQRRDGDLFYVAAESDSAARTGL